MNMKKLLILSLICLTATVQASEVLWSWVWLGTKTITEKNVQVGTLNDYYNQENEFGDGPYLTWRIKVTTEDLQEFYLPFWMEWDDDDGHHKGWNPGEYGVGIGTEPPGDMYGGNPGIYSDLFGSLSDYENAIFTMEVGLAYYEEISDNDWDMTSFSLVGYAIANAEELYDRKSEIGGIAPEDLRAWCPEIIIDTPVPEPTVCVLLLLGSTMFFVKRS